ESGSSCRNVSGPTRAGRPICNTADDAVRTRRVIDTARAIAERAYEGSEWTVSQARRAVRREPEIFDAALAHALAEGWGIETVESGQGDPKRTLRPGPKRPR